MKKIASLLGAAALMVASTGVAFGAWVFTNQTAFQTTKSAAVSNTGLNYSGGFMSRQATGPAFSGSSAEANANVSTVVAGGPSIVTTRQTAFQSTGSLAVSNTGANMSTGFGSSQWTGGAVSGSSAGSWANVSTVIVH